MKYCIIAQTSISYSSSEKWPESDILYNFSLSQTVPGSTVVKRRKLPGNKEIKARRNNPTVDVITQGKEGLKSKSLHLKQYSESYRLGPGF